MNFCGFFGFSALAWAPTASEDLALLIWGLRGAKREWTAISEREVWFFISDGAARELDTGTQADEVVFNVVHDQEQ